MKSPFDSDGKSYEYGMGIEQLFKETAEKHDFAVRTASPHENMYRHIDFFITTPEGKRFSVDVKGMKKLNRSDDSPQDEWLFLEFKNVRGDNGWLYGKADFIAFEMKDKFTFINRKLLVEIAEELVDMNAKVFRSSEAKYKTYTRNNRNDLVSMIRSTDLPSEKLKHWSK